MSRHRWDHHPPCRCGCGELADECSGPRPNPLGSMRVVKPVRSPWTGGDNHNQPNETTLHEPHDPGCCIVLTPPDATLNDPQEQR